MSGQNTWRFEERITAHLIHSFWWRSWCTSYHPLIFRTPCLSGCPISSELKRWMTLNDVLTHDLSLQAGTPQGSFFGRTLFLFDVNNQPDCVENRERCVVPVKCWSMWIPSIRPGQEKLEVKQLLAKWCFMLANDTLSHGLPYWLTIKLEGHSVECIYLRQAD